MKVKTSFLELTEQENIEKENSNNLPNLSSELIFEKWLEMRYSCDVLNNLEITIVSWE